jgi:hypothetical protein
MRANQQIEIGSDAERGKSKRLETYPGASRS